MRLLLLLTFVLAVFARNSARETLLSTVLDLLEEELADDGSSDLCPADVAVRKGVCDMAQGDKYYFVKENEYTKCEDAGMISLNKHECAEAMFDGSSYDSNFRVGDGEHKRKILWKSVRRRSYGKVSSVRSSKGKSNPHGCMAKLYDYGTSEKFSTFFNSAYPNSPEDLSHFKRGYYRRNGKPFRKWSKHLVCQTKDDVCPEQFQETKCEQWKLSGEWQMVKRCKYSEYIPGIPKHC